MRQGTILSIIIGAAAALLSVQVAAAHAEFVTATPAPGSVVATVPDRVTITFSESLDRGTQITVTGPTGAAASTGDTTRNGNTASVALQPAGNGVYTVTWTSVSAEDGDQASGSFQFGVGTPGTVFPRAGTGMTAARVAAWWPAAAALAGLLLGAALLRRRAGRQ
jgi:methionine-rich copper-binding protein CopC